MLRFEFLANGKRLREIWGFEEQKVQEFRNEANAFSDC